MSDNIVEIDTTEINEDNYLQYLTPEREPLPEDSHGEPLAPTDDDLTDEEVLAGRDDFDDDEDDDDEVEDTDDPATPDLNAE